MRTLNEIREVGLAVLSRTLGPADTIRFIQQYEHGSGDYTAGRDHLLGNPTVDELLDDIKQRRAAKMNAPPGAEQKDQENAKDVHDTLNKT